MNFFTSLEVIGLAVTGGLCINEVGLPDPPICNLDLGENVQGNQ